jgi:hypothetical protein
MTTLKKAPKSERVSLFHIVINTNKNEWTTNEHNLRGRFEFARSVLFLGEHPLVVALGLEDWTKEDKMDKSNVVEAEIHAGTPEYGDQRQRLHMHAVVKVRHRGYFRLNQPKLKAAFERVYGSKLAVFSIRGESDHGEEAKIYAGKNGQTETVKWKPS